MRSFLALFKMEYEGLLLPLCALIGLMAAMEALVFGLSLRMAGLGASFAYLIDRSGVPVVFAVSLAALLTLIVLQFMQNFTPSKSIYALLTLPVKRESIYYAKLCAVLLSGLCLVAVQLGLLILAHIVYMNTPGVGVRVIMQSWQERTYEDWQNAELYLGLINSSFLRVLFPPDVFSLLFSITGICGALCLPLYFATQVKSGKIRQAVYMTAVWLLLLLVSFPLYNYKIGYSVLKLILLFAFPFIISLLGANAFKTGEVAA